MLKEVTRLDKVRGTSARSVKQLLEDELEELPERELNPNKALVLYLNDTNGQYGINWSQGGMRMSECLALCDIAKGLFKREMEY